MSTSDCIENSSPTLVSIVIPASNEAGYISGLLTSIERHLAGVNYEVVVVNNGSTDETAAKAQTCPAARVITIADRVFPSVARNLGYAAAAGDIIVFLDADVIITPTWAQNLRVMLADKNSFPPAFVSGAPYHISVQPSWIERYWFEPLREKRRGYINGGNIITNRLTLTMLGGFDETLETGEDVAFAMAARAEGIGILTSDEWKVHHEGFPKTIGAFVRRESWHGKGDFNSIANILKSKIALGALLFVLLHLAMLVSLVMSALGHAPAWVILGPLAGILTVTVARAVGDIPPRSFSRTAITIFVSYLYFVGRSLSIWRSLRRS